MGKWLFNGVTILCCSVAFACLPSCADPSPRRLVIHAGRLIDGSGAPVQTAQRITVEDGSIVSIEADGPEPPDNAQQIDARGLTVLPGLIDAHTHVWNAPSCTPGKEVGLRQTVRNLHSYLRAGVTTVADLAGPTAALVSTRRFVGTALHRGPRLFVCGAALRAPAGYPRLGLNPNALAERGVVLDVANAAAGRQQVRALAEAQVDCIKVYLQETDFDGTPLPALDAPTLCAIVEEAHRQELRVYAHAITDAAYALALECGVDALAHGSGEAFSPSTQTALRQKRTPVLPTQWVFEAPVRGPELLPRLDSATARAAMGAESRADNAAYAAASVPAGAELPAFMMPHIGRAAAQANGAARAANTAWLIAQDHPLGLGTDSPTCFNWAGDPSWEMQRWVNAGMTPAAALQVATTGSARVLNLQDALGRIRPHYRADMFAVAGHPDEDLTALQQVRWVMLDGVMQRLDAAWYEPALLAWEMFRTWTSG